MKRPNKYSKPLGGERKESYHPADYTHNQYADDLNKYIDYLELRLREIDDSEMIEAGEFLTWISDNKWIRRDYTHPKRKGQYWSDIHFHYKTTEQLKEIYRNEKQK